jgi:aminoglycoside 2'-N-acetyltransferase I
VPVPELQVVGTDELTPDVVARIRALLDESFDDFTEHDWHHALGGRHVVALDGTLVAHAALVPRTIEVGGRALRAGYVEAVATAAGRRGGGIGSSVMRRIADLIRADHELGALSTGVHPFYERLGWERWRGPSFVRHGEELVRTPDEDDGIMVLRVDGTEALDLTLAIACEARDGDDW